MAQLGTVDFTADTAAELAKRLGALVAKAHSEEDLRVNMEMTLRVALPELPQPSYERAISTSTYHGRADAVHQGLIIEYEKPYSLRQPGKYEHAIQQACDYITGLALGGKAQIQKANEPSLFPPEVTYSLEDEERLASYVGLATDGESFVFIQRRRKRWDPVRQSLDADTVEKLILWLRAMSRRDLSPENLIEDFGPHSVIAKRIVGVLAGIVASAQSPKANVIYEEWRRLFGIVYGTEQLRRPGRDSEEVKAIEAAYELELGVGFPVLLFSIHTFYALLMKMLATELIIAQGNVGDTFVGSLARTKLRDAFADLESGELLQRHNIRNAIEQDFFGWYPEAWTVQLEEALWAFAQQLSRYDIGSFSLKPDRARDLLKDLYHGLIPEAVRHALGEYYTPDWLAEHTLDLVGYDGDPHRSTLDPSCGSGTFLLLAIHRVRRWLAEHPVEWGDNARKGEALDLIRRNIVGFDLNPLAVIASRTNYLFALGPLLRFRSRDFEVPVYLTDSVLLPGRADTQHDLFRRETVAFPMTVGTFHLPTEVVENHKVFDLMNILHDSIVNEHSRDAFIESSKRNLEIPMSIAVQETLQRLFDQIKKLETEGRNHIWAKLIRNRYASLFFREYFDFIVGNPPHVNWESLTDDWRRAAEALYQHYGLFTLSGLESRHGGGKKDIAALFTYSVIDHFLKDQGSIALVLHVSLFKTSGAGEGFRRFQLGNGAPFALTEVHDFKSFQPFQTHASMRIKTRTVTMRAVKGKVTSYPIPYVVWDKVGRGVIPGGLSWEAAQPRLASSRCTATPLRGTHAQGRLSPWLTISSADLTRYQRVIASKTYKPSYVAHEGINTLGLNGAYFIKVLEVHPNGTLTIQNLYDVGKIKVPKIKATIEENLIHPLIRGRSLAKWQQETADHVLILQDPEQKTGYEEGWLQSQYPRTWAYIKRFRKRLLVRKGFLKFFDKDRDPFYSMYSVGPATFATHKVVWMDISSSLKACAVEATQDHAPIPEHTVMFVAVGSAEEAFYLAGVLNSTPVGTIVAGYIVDNHISTHPFKNIDIPKFDSSIGTHRELADLSAQAHRAAADDRKADLSALEIRIDRTAERLWPTRKQEPENLENLASDLERKAAMPSTPLEEKGDLVRRASKLRKRKGAPREGDTIG